VRQKRKNLSDLFGNIRVLKQQATGLATPAAQSSYWGAVWDRIAGVDTGDIYVSVPVVHPRLTESQTYVAQFLLATVNLSRFRRYTAIIGTTSATLLICAVATLVVAWERDARRHDEYVEALEKIEDVMLQAPTPYCRLDSEDRIRVANAAFYQ